VTEDNVMHFAALELTDTFFAICNLFRASTHYYTKHRCLSSF